MGKMFAVMFLKTELIPSELMIGMRCDRVKLWSEQKKRIMVMAPDRK